MAKNSTNKKTRKNNLPVPAPAAPLPLKRVGVNVADVAMLTDIVRSVVLEFAQALPEQNSPEHVELARRRQGRQYAIKLRDRMKKFKSVYNAAWFVRHAESAQREYMEKKMREFWSASLKELENCKDIEAFTYAVADSLTAYRHGFPWEG